MIVAGTNEVKSTASVQNTANAAALGKNDFLKLLIEQIKNQDPLNPIENTEFTAQMAQFSSLEQLFNINDGIQNLTQYIASLNNTQALNLIGKEVVATGDNVHVKDGKGTDIRYTLDKDAQSVTITIMDDAGLPVRTISKGAQGAGAQKVSWNGLSDFGSPLKDGLYHYTVTAHDNLGNLVDATTFTTGVVTGINFENGITFVQIGDQEFMISDISQINTSDSGSGEEETSSTGVPGPAGIGIDASEVEEIAGSEPNIETEEPAA
jgi:flagellar basal-body rod modification protein FlgD